MLASILIVAALAASGAQTPRQSADASQEFLRKVIPHPTGKNGYEEFVLAAASVKYSKEIADAEASGSLTLGLKRAAVGMNSKALDLFRKGLKKQVLSPREHITFDTTFPELGKFRTLARLLSWEQEVYLADGRISLAIGDWRDGILFSRKIQMSTLIGGLVGIACEAITMAPLARHLDQLGYGQCHELQQTVTELLAMPDPTPAVIDSEFDTLGRTLNELADKPNPKLDELLGGFDEPDPGQPDPMEIFRRSPELVPQALREAASLVAKQREVIRAEMAKPIWERRPPGAIRGASELAAPIVNMVEPGWDKLMDRFATTEVRLRLVGTHAAILAHRWWFGDPPEKLDDLNIGDLATDPFTGKQFPYKAMGYAYKLYSVGSGRTDHGGRPGDTSMGGDGDLFLIRDGSR